VRFGASWKEAVKLKDNRRLVTSPGMGAHTARGALRALGFFLFLLLIYAGLVLHTTVVDTFHAHIRKVFELSKEVASIKLGSSNGSVGASVSTQATQAIGQISMATSGKPFVAERLRKWGGVRVGQRLAIQKPASFHQKPALAEGIRCANVAVVTTINPCTESIRKVGTMKGWCLVVVGDVKTESGTYRSLAAQVPPGKVTYLSYEDQLKLPYELVQITPARHFGRKNLGYIYAIHLGAAVIFDFDDDNAVIGNIPVESFSSKAQVFEHSGSSPYSVLNPYALWPGASGGMWPRGFPLTEINSAPHSFPHNGRLLSVGVVQSLANNDPDVDAIYRLGPRRALPLPMTFPSRPGGQVTYDKNVFAPWNAQATLFSRQSMWTLYLPTTVHGRVSDIWRSYIAQRLMWDVGQHVMYHDAFVKQTRNVHEYMGDYMSERPLYETSQELIRVLHSELSHVSSVPEAIESAYIVLYEFGFIQDTDVRSMQLWIQDLNGVGYDWPAIQAPHLGSGSTGTNATASTGSSSGSGTGTGLSLTHTLNRVLLLGQFNYTLGNGRIGRIAEKHSSR
jgi:hypothetical protein